jgi:hypothetical protein
MGEKSWEVQTTRDVLKRFGNTIKDSRNAYETFLAEGMNDSNELIETIRCSNEETENMHFAGCWVIGNHEFVQRAVNSSEQRRIHLSEAARTGIDIETISQKVCGELGVGFEQLKRKGRNNARSLARKRIAVKANREYQIPVVAIAKFFGIAPSSVSKLISRTEKEAS